MSPFARSDSPPPPMPSPQLVPTPLPSPHFSRHRTPSRKLSQLPSPHLLGSPVPEHRVRTSRSCDALHAKPKYGGLVDGDEFGPRKIVKTKQNRDVSPPTTPRSLPIPIPSGSAKRRSYRQSLSLAIPYRSPPPSPTIASPPPPVPPIPAFALGPTDKKPVLRTQPAWPTPIYIPELTISSPETVSMPSRKHVRSVIAPRREKGMTCVQFFALRNSTPRSVVRTAAV